MILPSIILSQNLSQNKGSMKTKLSYILAFTSCVFMVSCSEHDVLNSYEEIKEIKENVEELVPLSFIPYVATDVEKNATTRADLNYLSNVYKDDYSDMNLSTFNAFPWYSNGTGSATGTKSGKPDYRFGTYENNSYIVGMYGYYGLDGDSPMTWSTMTNNTNLPSLSSNFMTNQPLLHTGSNSTDWEYNPLKYWPNTTGNNAKVTFISYYPFQDFEPAVGQEDKNPYYRNGQTVGGKKYADLTCITPPALDARGEAAYTFTFEQHNEIGDQVDFLLGINKDIQKQGVNSDGISLELKHTLCAVAFDLRSETFDTGGAKVRYEVNYISLEGLYGKGKVYPTNAGPVWKDLERETTYTLNFEDYADYLNGPPYKPVFEDGKNWRYRRQFFYNNYKSTSTLPSGNTYTNTKNSMGMKLLMLVIPQKVELANDGATPKNAYVVVNYNITYDYGGGIVNSFPNNTEKIKLIDSQKQKSSDDKTQLFPVGKFITFNISFKGPKTIIMEDVTVSDWDDTVEYDLPTEEYNP